jgi:hypothetical protein
MQTIEQKYIEQLRNAGLFVSEPYPEGHGWEYGVRVGKPGTTQSNSIVGYDPSYITIGDAPEPPEMDAPMVVLYRKGDKWIVHAQDSVPNPGPADFQNVWTSPEDAIQDMLDFYFGNAERMRAKADARKLPLNETSSH